MGDCFKNSSVGGYDDYFWDLIQKLILVQNLYRPERSLRREKLFNIEISFFRLHSDLYLTVMLTAQNMCRFACVDFVIEGMTHVL